METMETEGFRRRQGRERAVLRFSARRRAVIALMCAFWAIVVTLLIHEGLMTRAHGPTGIWRELVVLIGARKLFGGLAVLAGLMLLGNLWLLVIRWSAAVVASEDGIQVTGLRSRRIPWSEVTGMSVIFVGAGFKPRSVFRIDSRDDDDGTVVPLRRIAGGTSAGHRFLARAEALRRAARE